MSRSKKPQVAELWNMAVLEYIAACSDIKTQRQIADWLETHPSVVCRIVKRLRDAGLVERVVDGVRLTARGRKKLS